MINTVEISLNVIERFNLSNDEIHQLIVKLQAGISTEPILPEPMNADEVYALNFEQWMVKNNLFQLSKK